MNKRLFLSPPHMGGKEIGFVKEAFASNYIAPVGPQLDAFEKEFCQVTGAGYAVALSSGTAALHLALLCAGVGQDDDVLCSSLTFVASANPILYLGARPVLVDSDLTSWNMDPELLVDEITRRADKGNLPKAVVLVHLYGQPADIDPILDVCDRYGVALIEDAAESLGAYYKKRHTGTFGQSGIFSFNGNKILTASSGGMLVSNDKDLADKVRFLSTQAREPAPHYEHREVGYNYRMSNVVAAIGRGQLRVLEDRVRMRQEINRLYKKLLADVDGITFMPEVNFGVSNCWLTVVQLDSQKIRPEKLRLALEEENIESRPVWKPMHMQPLFAQCKVVGGGVSEMLFENGLCLPSGSAMENDDVERVTDVIRHCIR